MNYQVKDISGFAGKYQVTSTGKVISLPKGDGNGNRYRYLKQEKLSRSHGTYRRVSLADKGKVLRFSVHRLVATAFIPNPDNKPHVNHIDSDPSNNHVDNLEWCTHSENMVHGIKYGNVLNTLRTNGKTTGKLLQDACLKKVKQKVGDAFITTYVVKGRRKVAFHCVLCSDEVHTRPTSNLVNEVKCNSCVRKKKI